MIISFRYCNEIVKKVDANILLGEILFPIHDPNKRLVLNKLNEIIQGQVSDIVNFVHRFN